MNNNKFTSGNEYCLRELFGNNTKIVIPDLQRDYCWGDNAYVVASDRKPHELVSGFINNIVELYQENKELKTTLGLIYGYEQPHNHIQICDGQQRLTTLFLLLGYINTRTEGKFSDFIISEEEMKDDYEPHLQYAIRESTLYFLSDLSKNIFMERTTSIAGIKQASWYFNEYEQDASIQSMISALETIHKYFEDLELNYEELGNFILDKLQVLYYDMENRSRGEETYIIINTTGEHLSASENIKPVLLGKLPPDKMTEYSDQWEEREDWFWQNRGNDKTADIGMQEFFVWYWQIGLIQENSWRGDKKIPINPKDLFISPPKKLTDKEMDLYTRFKDLDNLHKYFKGLQTLIEEICKNRKLLLLLLSISQKKNDTILNNEPTPSAVWNLLRHAELDIVLPLITLVSEHGCEMLSPFMRRLRKNRYDNIWGKKGNEVSRRGTCYIDWRDLVQIINQTTDNNLMTVDTKTLQISNIPNIDLPQWYNEDEQKKDFLKKKLDDEGQPLPIDEMEDNEFLMGDLTPLWETETEGESISVATVLKRWDCLKRICNALDKNCADKDIQFSNWFRLYRLISGIVKLQHIYNCKWNFEGCHYSMKPATPWWVESKQIVNLMKCEDLLSYMKEYVKENVKSFIHQPSDYKQLVMGWMTIKTIQADKENYLISLDNNRAISAFTRLKENYIIPMEEFHWGNVLCGYSWSHTIYPARDETRWANKSNPDSPITSLAFIENYNNRPQNVIDSETIEKGNKEVEELINSYFDT